MASAPYPGLRPYTAEERALFFGRDRDALLLRNKVLSSPITVLYALSGIGKSSLLRALVEPSLVEQGAHVMYYEEWAERDPVQGLRLRLRESIPPNLRSVSPTASLATIADAALAALNRPIVLILDQFEKLLLQRRESLDPLAVELAALVHNRSDIHVVLSLREEFLASLDVFRTRIVTLLSSTHRLRPLDDAGVRDAIVLPAEQCGGSVEEPDLVTALIRDLRADRADDPVATAGLLVGHVELPFLQLVCRQLWAVAGDDHRLTLKLYERLGRADGIIRDYVHGLTAPLRRRQRGDLARLLDLLAPRSGAKMAFAAEDLAHNAKVDPQRAADLLDHLVKSYVVRTRATATTTWYELYHDAFIHVLRSWVDRELSRVSRRRVRYRAAAVLVMVYAVGWVIWAYGSWRQKREHTEPIAQLRTQAWTTQSDGHVDDVVDWYLSQATAGDFAGTMDELLGLLAPVQDKIQREYGREEVTPVFVAPRASSANGNPGANGNQPGRRNALSAVRSESQRILEYELPTTCQAPARRPVARVSPLSREFASKWQPELPPSREEAALTCSDGPDELRILYGSRVVLERGRMADSWRETAEFLADSIGLPAPRRVVVSSDLSVHPDEISAVIVRAGQEEILDLPRLTDFVLVAENQLVNRDLRGYLQENGNGRWALLETWTYGGQWWRVPRWTLPLWRRGGHPTLMREQLLSLAILAELTKRPEVLINRSTVGRLLRRATGRRTGVRGNVDSAQALLLGLLKSRHSIRDAAGLLASFARYTGPGSDTLGLVLWRSRTEASCRLPIVGHVTNAPRRAIANSAELTEVLEALPPDSSADRRRQRLRVCILERVVAEGRYEAADSALETWPGAKKSWTAQENYLLGYWMVQRAATRTDGELTPAAWPRFEAAFHDLRDDVADSGFFELYAACSSFWKARQCWTVVDSVARWRSQNLVVAMLAGFELAERPGVEPATSALEHIDRAEAILREKKIERSPAAAAWFAIIRAQARLRLAEQGDSTGLEAATAALSATLGHQKDDPDGPADWRIYDQLFDNRLVAGRLDDAEQVLNQWPDDVSLYDDRALNRALSAFFIHLARDRLDSARTVAERIRTQIGYSHGLFVTALVGFLKGGSAVNTADSMAAKFYRTSHGYRDYLRMIQFWSLASRGDTLTAHKLIADRWAQIDLSSWPERAKSGDDDVWREMLVGIFARQTMPDRLTTLVTDSAEFNLTPFRHLGLPPRGLQCETFFYIGLFEAVTGPVETRPARAQQAFQRALQTGYVPYYEYHLARILERRYRESGGERTVAQRPR